MRTCRSDALDQYVRSLVYKCCVIEGYRDKTNWCRTKETGDPSIYMNSQLNVSWIKRRLEAYAGQMPLFDPLGCASRAKQRSLLKTVRSFHREEDQQA